MTVLDVTGQTNMGITKKLQGYADQVMALTNNKIHIIILFR